MSTSRSRRARGELPIDASVARYLCHSAGSPSWAGSERRQTSTSCPKSVPGFAASPAGEGRVETGKMGVPAFGLSSILGETRRGLRVSPTRAFSLVEVLVVVALMAGLSAMVVTGSGMLSGTRMRSAGTLIMSSVRMAVTRANSIGRPVRLVFDLDGGRLMLEETRGRMLRVKSADEGTKAGAAAATEIEQEAAEYAREIVQGPRAPEATFTPVESFGSDGDDPALGRELGRDIRFLQVQTEHDPEPRTDGRAYLYFWPGGGTERAAIQITRPSDHSGLTVLVSALTGRASLHRGRIELEEGRRDVDFQEREEP